MRARSTQMSTGQRQLALRFLPPTVGASDAVLQVCRACEGYAWGDGGWECAVCCGTGKLPAPGSMEE